MGERTERKRNWLKRLVVFAIVLVMAGVVGRFGIQRAVKSSLESQLATIGIGKPDIGKVSFSISGIRATEIRFLQSGIEHEPRATLDELIIHHSLFELITSNPVYDAIDLVGLQVFVEVPGADDQPIAELDWKSFSLPAKKLNIVQSAVVFRDGPERTFDIREIDLAIVPVGNKFQTTGVIASMIGGLWKLTGDVDPRLDLLAIELTTDELRLVNHRWQKWPFISPSIEQNVHGDARMKARVSITSSAESGLIVAGNANIDSLNLRFPWFDNLPVNIYEGDIEFRNQTIYYKDLIATVDGVDQLHASGETTIDQFPIKIKFQGDFRDLDLTSLRKLVAGIPGNVQGKATGDVVGLIDVEATTRTTVRISSDAQCSRSQFGQIDTEPLETETRIVDLIFDENQLFESVDGYVAVNGTTLAQPINNIFETFELTELQRRLELVGDFVSNVKLRLPLKTVSDLTTWHLSVVGQVDEATICGQAISGANIETALHEGELQFRPIRVTPLSLADVRRHQNENTLLPILNVAIEWPLIESPTEDELAGRVWASGEQVPTAWIRRFIDRQIENATRLTREEIDPDHRWAFEIGGQLDFETEFEIPVHSPDSLELWKGNGTVSNSTVIFDRFELGELAATLGLDKGLLSICGAHGFFKNGGQITADGHIDVRHQRDHQMEFTGRRLPFAWVAMLASEFSEEMKKSFVKAEIDTAIEQGELKGELSVDLRLTTQPEDEKVSWTIRSDIYSDRLSVGNEFVSNLKIEGYGIPNLIHVDKIHADLDDNGFVDAHGELMLDSATGHGSIEWEKLPVEWISRFAHRGGFRPNGCTNGKLVIRTIDGLNNGPMEKIPVEIEGSISTDRIRIGQFEFRPFSFDVTTRNDVVHFENVHSNNERFELDLRAQAALASPYKFAVVGNLDQLQLENVFQSEAASENADFDSGLNGWVAADFAFDGQFQPPGWQTTGTLSLTELSFDGRPASDIAAEWHHSNSDWDRSSFSARVLGGTIRMAKLERAPENLQLEIADIDLQQLNSLLSSEQNVSGVLNGTASISEWSNSNVIEASLELASPAIQAQEIMIRDFSGRARFQNRNLAYSFEAAALKGTLDGTGNTDLTQFNLQELSLPLEIRATNISLKEMGSESPALRSLQSFAGNLSAIGNFNFSFGQSPGGSGRIEFQDLNWKNQQFVKSGSTRFAINNAVVAFDDIRADLMQGSISGSVVLPVNRNTAGTYEFEIRQMNLGKLTDFTLGESTDVAGEFHARINGRLDREVSGQGFVEVQQAKIHGLDGQAFRLPVLFSFSPQNQSGKIEVRRSTFRLFDGKATASGTINFGPTLNVESNIEFANVNTGKWLEAFTDVEQANQGRMSGRLVINGRGIRSTSDLAGSFTGKVMRSSAFELPVIQDVARFVAGNNIQTQDYDSDEIGMRLNKGRIEVVQLNFANPFAKISIRGDAFLDGRLDLQVAARVDNLGQPSLIEELAGSPLAGFTGSPVVFMTQAADFLSERVVFLRVNGTFRRPRIRPDSGKQISDEVIRYFLRGSQILPNGLRRND